MLSFVDCKSSCDNILFFFCYRGGKCSRKNSNIKINLSFFVRIIMKITVGKMVIRVKRDFLRENRIVKRRINYINIGGFL